MSILLMAIVMGLWTAFGFSPGQSREENWQSCRSTDDHERSIMGCSALIQSNGETSTDLAKAHYDRALGYTHTGNYDLAVRISIKHCGLVQTTSMRTMVADRHEQASTRPFGFRHSRISMNCGVGCLRTHGRFDQAIRDVDQTLLDTIAPVMPMRCRSHGVLPEATTQRTTIARAIIQD